MLSTMVQLISSPFGFERPEVGLGLVFLFAHAPQRGRLADVFGARAAVRLEAHGIDAGLGFSGALRGLPWGSTWSALGLRTGVGLNRFAVGRRLIGVLSSAATI